RMARPRIAAAIHVLALALQGLLWGRMLAVGSTTATALIVAFAVAGLGLAWLWRLWGEIPHPVGMAFVMITLAKLGMQLWWWLDMGRRPFQQRLVCCSNSGLGWGMWSGMFLAGNLAMGLLARRSCEFSWPAWLGCNLGMGAGMMLGGNLITSSPVGHFAGMA